MRLDDGEMCINSIALTRVTLRLILLMKKITLDFVRMPDFVIVTNLRDMPMPLSDIYDQTFSEKTLHKKISF